mmetsp:Transcript_5395/g.13795  ORF Transcript_5395/g.13795 Transcript_5395/m.13795 type:complete len:207 (-) Transcript_5395:275-895(-)
MEARQTTPRATQQTSSGVRWGAASPVKRISCPTPQQTSSDILHRDEIPMSVRRNSEKANEMFSPSSERQHAAEQRRIELLAKRHDSCSDRVLQYASNPSSYQSTVRKINKSALDQLTSQQQMIYERERGLNQAADQAALLHAQKQEQLLQKRQQTRQEHAREAAEYNRRAVQQQQAARQEQKAAERQMAQEHVEKSFFDRFGKSLA